MIAELENRLEIQTGDGVTFSLPLAGLVSRWLALVVDGAALAGIFYAMSFVARFFPAAARDFSAALMIVIYFAVSLGYSIGLEWFWGGRTLGKRVLNIRVANASGLRLTFPQILMRNLLNTLDSLPFSHMLGGTVALFNSRSQRLGDLAAGTIVVRDGEIRVPTVPSSGGPRGNSMAPYRTLCARLRQKTGPELARVALEALRRRDQFEPAARLAVFAELAAGFRSLAEFPEEATLFLTDEQYLWNVVEILFEQVKRRAA